MQMKEPADNLHHPLMYVRFVKAWMKEHEYTVAAGKTV